MPPSYPPQQPPDDGGGLYPPPSVPPDPPSAPQPDGALLPWRNEIEQRIAELENRPQIPGPQGPPGRDGNDGKDGKDGKDGVSPDPAAIAELAAQFIQIDVDALELEIQKRIEQNRDPIYIGAKDWEGNVTMPLTPVRPGDGVYIKVRPYKLGDK